MELVYLWVEKYKNIRNHKDIVKELLQKRVIYSGTLFLAVKSC